MKLKGSITNFELYLCCIFWIGSVSYAIYSALVSTNEFFVSFDFEDTYEDFTNGWFFLNRFKDVSDYEWKYFQNIIILILPWCLIHLIVAEILRISQKQLLIYWYAAISLLFIFINFGIKTLIYYTFQPILGYVVLQFKSKIIIWLYSIVCLISMNYFKWQNFEFYNLHNYFEFMSLSGMFWGNLRISNYFLEAVNDTKVQKITFKNIVTVLAYCLYLPLLFLGPLVLFTDFKIVFAAVKTKNITQRLTELVKNLLRFIFWALFIEFALHFVYVNAFTYYAQSFEEIGAWAFYGVGYTMGQYFHLKYVVFYGISTSLANFEGINVPNIPKCIGRIYLYSDMWKYFDRGLYLFLLRYIYIPIYGEKKIKKTILQKIFASFVSFVFVYFWHGYQKFVAIWSFLNFVGVTIEAVGTELSQTNFVKNKITKNISDAMYRRLKCILAAPLFAMSAISNFYFFGGKHIGDIYVYRFLQGPFYVTLNVLIFLYFGCQVSIEIKLWEESRKCKKVS